ncbi:flagellar protein FlgN [Candidatus Methylospira mobilis]|uniref:Flagellar protein FlgN n=1 Tax=Candidatus Methylospira mobilis TaxID=1808979 RepID=A0A5Q0BJT7_9GAMM|nr:flagellar protein FlgN [Candidatus Methylospira mobilis]QFY42427.1 flagellar protein FlgN [Candidatus Methylospira mobilis]
MVALLAELQGGLKAESAAVQDLLDVLEAEREILLKPGVDGLDSVVARKNAMVMQVSELTRQRYSLLVASGFSSDEDGMKACVSVFSGDPACGEVEQAWKALGAIAQKVKKCNEFNGQLVSRLLARNQDLLAVFGMATQRGGGLYGPNGRAGQFISPVRRDFSTG